MAHFLQAAINGTRSQNHAAQVPTTTEALAKDAQQVVVAGATDIHFHIRALSGEESLAAEDADQCIASCRQAVPKTGLGVSTGAWILPDVDARLCEFSRWSILPDYVSVNFHEERANEVAQLFHERGVGIELGLSTVEAAEDALAAGWGAMSLRILLEPDNEGDVAEARAVVAGIEKLLDAAGVTVPRLLHGFDTTAWALVSDALQRGYQCRAGFEDMLMLPTGEPAASNAQIIALVRSMQETV